MAAATGNDPSMVAPRSLEALRARVVCISRGEASVSLGAKALNVLARLVERPEEVAMGSITKVAAALEVHPSTLSRLARALGYDAYVDFQRVFRDSLTAGQRPFYSQQGHRLLGGDRASDENGEGSESDCLGVVVQIAHESVANVDALLSQLSAAELSAAAALLARARRVRVYGVRQIHAVASLLSYSLGLIRADVSLFDAPGQGIAETLAHMRAGDVLLACTVAPYSRRVVEVARAASAAGIAVVAITDSRASPLAVNARHAFFIPHRSSFISNSIGAYVVFCEGLVNLVARALGDKAVRALERQESFIDALNIELR